MIRTASYRSSSYASAASPRRRAAALLLALALVVALIVALVTLGALGPERFVDVRPLSTFNVAPAAGREARQAPKAAVRPKQEEARETRRTPPRRTRQTQPVPTPPLTLPGVMVLSSADFRASDVSRLPRRAEDGATGVASADAAEGGARAAGPGAGPGGETLYAADWYREPTRAELATYLPARATTGWGMIACRTVERFRVEDCRELGESPGSGIGRALRRASWQFMVRPPRVGGKTMVGTWVRIKFDLVEGPVK